MNNQLPYCPYCDRNIYHKPKEPCKKYTKEKEEEYHNQIIEKEKQARLETEQKAKFNEEMKRFTVEYPLLASYFQKVLEKNELL